MTNRAGLLVTVGQDDLVSLFSLITTPDSCRELAFLMS